METQFHLLFPSTVPLIPLEDLFVEYEENEEDLYILNILMKKAKNDLAGIFKKGGYQPMSMQQFFPVFRDCILGLTFMHIKNIAHRDLKPGNIMELSGNRFVLAAYGVGLNLQFEYEHSGDNVFF